MLKQLTKVTKAVLGDDPFALAHNRAPSGGGRSSSRSGGSRSGPVGMALAAALSSLSPGSEAATLLAAEGSIVPLRAAQSLSLLVLGNIRTNGSSTNLAAMASQHNSVMATALSTTEMSTPDLSLMELMLHEALGSSSGVAAGVQSGGGGNRVLSAPRAGVGVVSTGFAASGASTMIRSGGSCSQLVTDERLVMGSRAERWQAALLTSANASRRSRAGPDAVEKKRFKPATQPPQSGDGSSSRVHQSADHTTSGGDERLPLQHSDGRDPVGSCVEGWEDSGDIVHPSSGTSPRLPSAPLKDRCRSGGGTVEDGSTATGSNTIAGSGAAASSDLPAELLRTMKGGPARPQPDSNTHIAIAVLAAQAQAAHLVKMLAGNQQLLSDIWAVDAGIRPSLTTSLEGHQQQRPTASDKMSRSSDAPSSSKLLPTCSDDGSSQRDTASRHLSAILTKMRSEAEGLGGGGDGLLRRQRRRSVTTLAYGAGGSSVARLMEGCPPNPTDEMAAAASLDMGVDGGNTAVAAHSSAPALAWRNTFGRGGRFGRSFGQQSASSSSGPLFRIRVPPEDVQSIAE